MHKKWIIQTVKIQINPKCLKRNVCKDTVTKDDCSSSAVSLLISLCYFVTLSFDFICFAFKLLLHQMLLFSLWFSAPETQKRMAQSILYLIGLPSKILDNAAARILRQSVLKVFLSWAGSLALVGERLAVVCIPLLFSYSFY